MKALNNYVSAAGLVASMQARHGRIFWYNRRKFLGNQWFNRPKQHHRSQNNALYCRRYDSGFFLRLMAKDVTIASELMTNAGFDAPITPALNSYLATALKTLGHDADHTRVYEIVNPAPTGQQNK